MLMLDWVMKLNKKSDKVKVKLQLVSLKLVKNYSKKVQAHKIFTLLQCGR